MITIIIFYRDIQTSYSTKYIAAALIIQDQSAIPRPILQNNYLIKEIT
jgi:hypothetical protein